MNKIIAIIILGLLLGCSINKEREILGTWIEVNNYQYPAIYIIKEDSFMLSYDDFRPVIYKIKNDTILFQSFNAIHKK